MHSVLDHIAIVMKDFESALLLAQKNEWLIGETQVFLGEGTEEIYIGEPATTRLLLIKPIAEGPYQDALNKRGEGFHHLGIVCQNVKDFTNDLCGSGWNLHPKSLQFWTENESAWAVHSGAPLLELSPTMLYPEGGFECSFPFPETRLLNPLPDQIHQGPRAIREKGKVWWNDLFAR